MSIYKHGISTTRKSTGLTAPITSAANVTVVIGTAPINMAADPYRAANVPMVAYSKSDAVAKMGWSEDFQHYTIMQSVYASFQVFAVAPLVMINVLDPSNENHITAVTATDFEVSNKKTLIPVEGILHDKISISVANGDAVETLEEGTDYVTSFADDGTTIIGYTEGGVKKAANGVKIAYTKLNPEGVTYQDIVGGYNVSTRLKKGMEVIADIYPKFGIVPGTLIAPGFSHIPAVNTAMTAKAQLIYSLFSCKVISDIDSGAEGAASIDAVKEWKNKNGYSDRRMFAAWPKVNVDGYHYYFSAQLSALLQKIAAENGGVPSDSCDNKLLKISGLVLEDGTEVIFDMDEANDYLNANGVISAVNVDGFLAWGNNTSVYPVSTDVVDRWVTSVMMFDYIENNFKRSFFSKVSNKTNYRQIEDVVLSENLTLNGLKGHDDIAGGEISFSREENPITQIIGGNIKFHERLATYPPMEDIQNEFEFDPTILEAALSGGN